MWDPFSFSFFFLHTQSSSLLVNNQLSPGFGRANISNEKLRRGNIISVSDHWRRKTREIEPFRIDRQEMTFMIFSSPYFWRTPHTGRHRGVRSLTRWQSYARSSPPVSQKMMIVMLTVMCDDNDHRLSEHQQPSKIFKENLFNCDLSQSIDCRQKRPESIKSITSNTSLCILANSVRQFC